MLKCVGTASRQETKDGFVLTPPPEEADRRTAAEKRHDEKMAARQGEKTRKMAMKSHRERVNEFNAALESLSEHHDIPRVRQDPVAVVPAKMGEQCGIDIRRSTFSARLVQSSLIAL